MVDYKNILTIGSVPLCTLIYEDSFDDYMSELI